MSQLASEFGIRKASLYHYVNRKEALLYEISADSLQRITAAAETAIASESEPVDRLRALIRAHLVTALGDRNEHATMLTALRSLTAAEYDEVATMRNAYDELVQSLMLEGQRAGVIRTDILAALLRLSLLNMLNWTIFWFHPDGSATIESLAADFESIFLDGAGKAHAEDTTVDAQAPPSGHRRA